MPEEKKTWKQRWRKKFILLGASLLFACVLAEVALRLLPSTVRHWFPEGMYVNDSDPEIRYRLASDFQADIRTPHFRFSARMNAHGFRGPELDEGKVRPTIYMAGDSFAFGQGVDDADTVAAISRKALPDIQIVNAGVYDYQPSQSYRTYQRFAASHAIDTLVIQLCHNDVLDQSEPIVRGVHSGYLNPSPPTSMWGEFKDQLRLRSELVARLRFAYFAIKADARPLLDCVASDFETRRAPELSSTKDVLGRWIDEARKAGHRVVLYYVPHELQVDPKSTGDVARWRSEGERVDLDAGHRWLSGLLAAHPDVEYVDIVERFRKHMQDDGSTLYISRDEHTNAKGNAIIAETLLPTLRSD